MGQARRFYSFRFTNRVVVRSERGDVTSHWCDVLLDFARAIGCDTEDRRYRFVPTAQDERDAAELLAGCERFIILNPCNAIASRRSWPLAGWAELARDVRDRYDARVLVSGSPADARSTEGIVRLASTAARESFRLPGARASAHSARSRGARARSSESRPVRCTWRLPSAARR